MPLDTNVFDKIKTFQDYQRADQDFQLRKQQAAQQLQTGAIDQQTKQLSLIGQIVGNNSVDQASYDRARQVAQSQGLDVSALPDQFNKEVVGRLRFAGATPTAQLSAMIATQGHQLNAGKSVGDVNAYGYGTNNEIGSTAPTSPPTPVVSPGKESAVTVYGNAGIPPVAQPAPNQPPQVLTSTDALPGTEQPISSPPVVTKATPTFSFRQQRQGETIDAYKAAQQQAFDIYKADPQTLAAQENAKKTGADAAEATKGAAAATETLGRLNQNLDALKTLNGNMPEYGGILPVSVKARAGLVGGETLGDAGKGYNALQQWNEVNQQQVINAISELVKGGQIRGNQYIEKIINRGFAIDPDAPKATRDAEIETLRNELKNAAVQAQNTSAAYTGQPKQPYNPTLPPQAGQPTINPSDAVNELRRRGKL